jgi:hypothetical protein
LAPSCGRRGGAAERSRVSLLCIEFLRLHFRAGSSTIDLEDSFGIEVRQYRALRIGVISSSPFWSS